MEMDPGQGMDPGEGSAIDMSSTEPAGIDDTAPAVQSASGSLAIPEPMLYVGGTSSASVTTSLAGAGLVIDGGAEPGSYVNASYAMGTGPMRATAAFTVNAAAGAAFSYSVRGTGNSYATRYLRIRRVPGSDALEAQTATGNVVCGTLASGQAVPVALVFDGGARTFDVQIGGAPSACTGLTTRVSGPFTGFKVNDETLQEYGGHVDFTGFAVTAQ